MKLSLRWVAFVCVTALAVSLPVTAADTRAEIARKLEIRVEDVRPGPVPGLFEVSSGAEIAYVSTDGRFYIHGDVFDLDTRENLTDRRRTGIRAGLLAAFPDADAVVFGPADAKYTIDVFTDVDCSYCRKLHSEIAEINRRGLRVRYLMYPRSGPGTDSWRKAEAVLCAKDRRDALTRAKRGEALPKPGCKSDAVKRSFALGQDVGISGTPGILTDSGVLIAGYLPAEALAERVKRLEAGARPDATPKSRPAVD